MVYTKRKRSRSARRFRRVLRRPRRKSTKKRSRKSDVYHTKFHADPEYLASIDLINNSPGILNYRGLDFRLNQCSGFDQWSKMFEKYRINMVVVKLIPCMTQVQTGLAGGTVVPSGTDEIPMIYSMLDFNDTAFPATGIDLFFTKKPRCKKTLATRRITYKFRPRLLNVVYGGTTSGALNPSYTAKASEWLELNETAESTDIPHFGFKCAMDGATTVNKFRSRFEITYYVSFKDRIA